MSLLLQTANRLHGSGTLKGVVSTDEFNALHAAICECRKAIINGEPVDACGVEVLEVLPTGGMLVVVEVIVPTWISEPSQWDYR